MSGDRSATTVYGCAGTLDIGTLTKGTELAGAVLKTAGLDPELYPLLRLVAGIKKYGAVVLSVPAIIAIFVAPHDGNNNVVAAVFLFAVMVLAFLFALVCSNLPAEEAVMMVQEGLSLGSGDPCRLLWNAVACQRDSEVMLSYCWRDNLPLVRRCARVLSRAGFSVWIDVHNLQPGSTVPVPEVCRSAALHTPVAIAFWGEGYQESGICKEEFRALQSKGYGKLIIHSLSPEKDGPPPAVGWREALHNLLFSHRRHVANITSSSILPLLADIDTNIPATSEESVLQQIRALAAEGDTLKKPPLKCLPVSAFKEEVGTMAMADAFVAAGLFNDITPAEMWKRPAWVARLEVATALVLFGVAAIQLVINVLSRQDKPPPFVDASGLAGDPVDYPLLVVFLCTWAANRYILRCLHRRLVTNPSQEELQTLRAACVKERMAFIFKPSCWIICVLVCMELNGHRPLAVPYKGETWLFGRTYKSRTRVGDHGCRQIVRTLLDKFQAPVEAANLPVIVLAVVDTELLDELTSGNTMDGLPEWKRRFSHKSGGFIVIITVRPVAHFFETLDGHALELFEHILGLGLCIYEKEALAKVSREVDLRGGFGAFTVNTSNLFVLWEPIRTNLENLHAFFTSTGDSPS